MVRIAVQVLVCSVGVVMCIKISIAHFSLIICRM